MSVQIKISYETDNELLDIASRLEQPGMKIKHAERKGKFRRAYVRINNPVDKTEPFRYNSIEQMCDARDINEEYPI